MGGFLVGTDPGLRQTRTPTVDVLTDGVGYTSGSSTTITLSDDPGSENHVVITFDGVVQHHDTYSQSGAVITFDAAIPSGVAKIEAIFTVTVPSVTVPDDSVTLAKLAGGTDGELITWDASGDPAAVGAGASGQVLTSNGAGAAPTMQDAAAGGKLLQKHYVRYAAGLTGTTIVPNDDTVPTISEGTEFMTTNFTPLSATSTFHIVVVLQVQAQGNGRTTISLHQDGGSASVSTAVNETVNATFTAVLEYELASVGTSSITFAVRAGPDSAMTVGVNNSLTTDHSASMCSTITVWEVEA